MVKWSLSLSSPDFWKGETHRGNSKTKIGWTNGIHWISLARRFTTGFVGHWLQSSWKTWADTLGNNNWKTWVLHDRISCISCTCNLWYDSVLPGFGTLCQSKFPPSKSCFLWPTDWWSDFPWSKTKEIGSFGKYAKERLPMSLSGRKPTKFFSSLTQ